MAKLDKAIIKKIKELGRDVAKEWLRFEPELEEKSWAEVYRDWQAGNVVGIPSADDFELLDSMLGHEASRKEMNLFDNAFWDEVYARKVSKSVLKKADETISMQLAPGITMCLNPEAIRNNSVETVVSDIRQSDYVRGISDGVMAGLEAAKLLDAKRKE